MKPKFFKSVLDTLLHLPLPARLVRWADWMPCLRSSLYVVARAVNPPPLAWQLLAPPMPMSRASSSSHTNCYPALSSRFVYLQRPCPRCLARSGVYRNPSSEFTPALDSRATVPWTAAATSSLRPESRAKSRMSGKHTFVAVCPLPLPWSE